MSALTPDVIVSAHDKLGFHTADLTRVTRVLLSLSCQVIKRTIERTWWDKIRNPETIRSLLELVYARPQTIDDQLLQRILEATEHPSALDAFTSIMLSPRTELTFDEMLQAIRCPVCMAYGGFCILI